MPLYGITAPSASYEISNLGIATSVGASALTITLTQADGSTAPTIAQPVKVGMRSSTLTSGLYNQRLATATATLVISSGSTLGQISGVPATAYIYLIDNAGTLELAISGALFPETGVITTVAEGGAGAADLGSVMYSTTARSSVSFRLIGKLLNTQATAGTWASAGTVLSANMRGNLTPVGDVIAMYTGAPVTGTLNTGFNTVTYGTKVLDTHGAYSSGTYTVPTGCDGVYAISAQLQMSATYVLGNTQITAIAINGTTTYKGVDVAAAAIAIDYLPVNISAVRLKAGDTVIIQSLNSGTSPTFTGDATTNWFTIARIGNY